jgi:hypothetical protein
MKRKIILQEIFSHFQKMTQWITLNPSYYSKYYSKAQALIELLEVEDCGSIGGYDLKNPVKWESNFSLYDRFLALIRKKNTKLDKECYFTPATMKQYWIKINQEREKYR